MDRLLDQAQRAGCDVTLAKMVLATRSVSTSQVLDILGDPDKTSSCKIIFQTVQEIITIIILNERLSLCREITTEMKMTTLQVSS